MGHITLDISQHSLLSVSLSVCTIHITTYLLFIHQVKPSSNIIVRPEGEPHWVGSTHWVFSNYTSDLDTIFSLKTLRH
jgi:hypothetical protein